MTDKQKILELEDQLVKEQARIQALNAEVASLQESGIAMRVNGVSPEIAEDVNRRVAAGLPIHHAVAAARSQAENDKRILEEEKRDALKIQHGRELMEARLKLADLEAQHELERTNARIAELEEAKAARTQKAAA